MDDTNIATNTGYRVPTYTLGRGEAWYHFLYGNVPGHQIDFIYRPEVPQEPLSREHFKHLSRVLQFIEPRRGSAYSFAITNLSRDDTQYEPGHGGVAFTFGLRIKGARDHAGRQDPPFCHCAAIVDRHLDVESFYGIAAQFHQKLLPDQESQAEGSGWYHTYVAHAENPDALLPVLKMYVEDFADLYVPAQSRLGFRWTVANVDVPRRVVVVYPDRADFPTIAYAMARIAAVLVESDVKWTAISNGREQDVPGGLTVRFIPEKEATSEGRDVVLLGLEHVPMDPAEIAKQLFGAEPVEQPRAPELPVNLPFAKEADASNGARRAQAMPEEPPAVKAPEPLAAQNAPVVETAGFGGLVTVVERKDNFEPLVPHVDLAAELKKKQRKQSTTALMATMFFIIVFGVLALIWFSPAPQVPPEPAASSSVIVPDKPKTTSTASASATASAVLTATASASTAPQPSVTNVAPAPKKNTTKQPTNPLDIIPPKKR